MFFTLQRSWEMCRTFSSIVVHRLLPGWFTHITPPRAWFSHYLATTKPHTWFVTGPADNEATERRKGGIRDDDKGALSWHLQFWTCMEDIAHITSSNQVRLSPRCIRNHLATRRNVFRIRFGLRTCNNGMCIRRESTHIVFVVLFETITFRVDRRSRF